MTQLKDVPLQDIEMIKNYRDVEPVSEKDPDIIELSKSIVKIGVLEPILLRPHQSSEGKYQLIFGHRRFVASRVAALESIPSNIREVDDDDILEIQVTENLQRKDVHPLDEAMAFRSLMKDRSYQVEEIAARFGKKPEFVTQRLKLNDLTPELQKDFKLGKMLVGQALLICRLQPSDQIALKKNRENREQGYGTLHDVQDYIDRNVIHKLSAAPFKLSDTSLNPGAGACQTCPKRSGANPMLFPDVKDTDRCFDAGCFHIKLHAFASEKIKEVLETQPEVLIIKDHHNDVAKTIAAQIKALKVKVLTEYSDFSTSHSTYGSFNKKAQGIWISGDKIGKVSVIYIKGPTAKEKARDVKPADMPAEDIKTVIAGIKEREKRAKELDIEKIHKATLEQLEKNKEVKKVGLAHQGLVDRGIMVFLLLHEVSGFSSKDDILKELKKLPKEPPYNPHAFQFDYIKKLGAITDDELAFIIRTICLDKWGNPKTVGSINEDDTTLRLIAEYSGIDLKAIENAQSEVALKRAERVEKRIKDLQVIMKENAAPKAKKAAPKKKVKPSSNKGIKTLVDMSEDELDEMGGEDDE